MAKISKSDLKYIVKECLMELLQEGIGQFSQPAQIQSRQQQPQQQLHVQQKKVQQHRPAAAQPLSPILRDVIKREAAGDRVMESIFADTAKTTLPAQIKSEARVVAVQPGSAEEIVNDHTPEDIFGDEMSAKWASLAFADVPKK